MITHLVPKMVTGGVAWELIKGFPVFYAFPICGPWLPPFWSRKGCSTILYVTFSFVLLRLFSSLVNISEKFRQIIINLKPSKKELGSLIHFSWFQIWILVPTPTLNLVETKLYICKINVKLFLQLLFSVERQS